MDMAGPSALRAVPKTQVRWVRTNNRRSDGSMSRSVGGVNGSVASGSIGILSSDNIATMRRSRDDIRQQLLDSALVEFGAKGFDGASTRSIAQRVDAHQPQINYHFESKEALWAAAVDHLFALLADDLVDLRLPASSEDPALLAS